MEKGSILESMKYNREWANDPSGSEAILKGFENVSNHQSHWRQLTGCWKGVRGWTMTALTPPWDLQAQTAASCPPYRHEKTLLGPSILSWVVPVLPDPEIRNSERLGKQRVSGSACVLHLSSIIVQLFEAWKKSEKYKVNCFRKLEGFGRVPRKIQRVLNRSKKSRASRWGRKCQGSISGCWKFPEVSENVQMLWNGAGRLRKFGRVENSENRKVQESYKEEFHQVGGARCSWYSNCRMYRKEASFIL